MRQTRTILGTLLVSIVAGIVSSTIVATAAYYLVRDNLSMMVAEGLSILNVPETTESLGQIVSTCREISATLNVPTSRPTDETVASLLAAMKRMREVVQSVKETEYYTVAELRSLASEGTHGWDREHIVMQFKDKPKRVVVGLPQIDPQIAAIEETIHALDRALREHPMIDVVAMNELLARIETTAAAAQASLASRESAALLTLEKFGKNK